MLRNEFFFGKIVAIAITVVTSMGGARMTTNSKKVGIFDASYRALTIGIILVVTTACRARQRRRSVSQSTIR